jgi:hypothetical protein
MQIEIFLCKPNNQQEFLKIDNTLEGFRKLINGNFTIITLYQLADHNIVLIADEEALMKDDPKRTLWIDTTWIYNTCFLCKFKGGKFVTLEEEDKQAILAFMVNES